MTQAKVTVANNNAPVKLRRIPNGEVLESVPQGTIVEVVAERDETWSLIKVGNIQGYMMSKFLAPVPTNTNLSELKAELKKVIQLLDKLEI